ncbi:MAG: DUF4834 family protein [Bacteroides sp.]|nr:DUF4834 family protein [Bacteroides sp.]MDD2645951.1 DUF4834 family protein [Bacteroides sp.]MDD4055204.1 DUF4834 family protein [Bacteroides sp.]MDD4720665.1 DUF4834 family protein [Bacteroides sp.]NLI63859.1 DUF4834 family protein [Bacteroidales bacterium]
MSILGFIFLIILVNQIVKLIYSFIYANKAKKEARKKRRTKTNINNQQRKDKIFSADEGEYVEYEEVIETKEDTKKD